MIHSPTTHITQAQTSSYNKERVESELRGLQDKHRLAMHVWERSENGILIPPALRLNAKDTSEGKVGGKDMLSLSLLPAKRTGYSLLPWGVENMFIVPRPSYLFSLDQEEAQPATVFRVSPSNVYSSAHTKDLVLYNNTGYTPVDSLYRDFRSESDMRGYLQAGNCRTFSTHQLDALAGFYDPASDAMQQHIAQHYFGVNLGVCEHNEVIAGVAREHLRAIAVPFYETYHTRPSHTELELYGALMGLQHLERGMNLPVVCYHVNGPLQGQCTYIGQGREELTAVALHAIGQLQERNILKRGTARMDAYQPLVSRTLRLDVGQSLQHQQEQIRRLEQGMNPGANGVGR